MIVLISVICLLIVVAVPLTFYLKLKLPPSQDASFFEDILIGHRGCRDFESTVFDFQENTISSCIYAMEHGAHGVEFDLLLSKDGVPIVFHDTNSMTRVCHPIPSDGETRDSKSINKITLEQIKQYKYNKGKQTERIATLEELIQEVKAVNSDVKMMIEAKEFQRSSLMAQNLVKVFEKHNLYRTCVVGSFNPLLLYYVRKINPKIVTLLLVRKTLLTEWLNESKMTNLPINPFTIIGIIGLFKATGLISLLDWILYTSTLSWLPSFLGIGVIGLHSQLIFDGLVNPKKLQKRGYAVNVWVVNKEEEKKDLLEIGKLSITTDVLFPTK